FSRYWFTKSRSSLCLIGFMLCHHHFHDNFLNRRGSGREKRNEILLLSRWCSGKNRRIHYVYIDDFVTEICSRHYVYLCRTCCLYSYATNGRSEEVIVRII